MNSRTTPKDFFLHVGATIALYAGIIALLDLAFDVIDYLRPDALAGYLSPSSIAWPISMLVVLVPAVYVIEWFLVRDIRSMPEKADVWVRRWRIYLTLFLAGATIVGDLIVLINTYLNGEITGRFVLKVIAIFVVIGITFAYYLLARAKAEARSRGARRSLAVAGLILVLGCIALGFWIVGSPSTQRDLRFDSQRASDLQNIQWQIVTYYQRTGALPVSLGQLQDPISGFTVPADPQTDQQYMYSATTTRSFELCATFAQPTPANASVTIPGGSDDSWAHGAGQTCFDRSIDPKLYPVTLPAKTP